VQDFPANPVRALKHACLALRRQQTPPEFAHVLVKVPGFDRAVATTFLLHTTTRVVLNLVLAAHRVAGDFVATLRKTLTSPPLLLPGDADAMERLLHAVANCFLEGTKDAFACDDDAVTVAFLLVVSSVRKVPPAAVAKQLCPMLSGKAPSEADLTAMLAAVMADPIQIPPMQLPLAAAPRLTGWGKMKAGKGGDKAAIMFMVMNSFCIFFFKDAKELRNPLSVVHLPGTAVQPDPKENLKLQISAVSGSLAFVKYQQPGGKPKVVSGVKKMDIMVKSPDVFAKWMTKLKRAIVMGMFEEPRQALNVPPIVPLPTVAE
jgi:hypothetical protein